MIDYQSYICKKCGRAVLRTADTKYCHCCGAKLPELKEIPKAVCPICQGTGKIEARAYQPFNPMSPYFNVMTNENQGAKNE